MYQANLKLITAETSEKLVDKASEVARDAIHSAAQQMGTEGEQRA